MSGWVSWWILRVRDILDSIVKQGLTDGERDGTSEKSNKARPRKLNRGVSACKIGLRSEVGDEEGGLTSSLQ